MAGPELIQDIDLKPQEARFLEAYLLHGNASRAAREAGCKCKSDQAFRVRGSQMLKNLNYPLKQLMAAAGLTSPAILRTIAQGMHAKTAHVSYDSAGKLHVYKTPDHGARARFTDMAIRLMGGYPKSQLELPFQVEDGRLVITAEFETNTPVGEPGAGVPA
jgi:hypothetical protein